MSERRRVTATLAARLLKTLLGTPCTREALAQAVGLSLTTTSAWLRELSLAKLVHVCRWDPDARGYLTVAVFAWAPGASDVPRPTRTRAQQMADWRAAKKGGAA